MKNKNKVNCPDCSYLKGFLRTGAFCMMTSFFKPVESKYHPLVDMYITECLNVPEFTNVQ